MAKYGVRIKIDVKKIVKEWLFSGAKGVYLDATCFIDVDNQDQYGNNGMINQDLPKGQEGDKPILGNCKVFWSDVSQQTRQQQPMQQPAQQSNTQGNNFMPDLDDGWDSDIPF